MLKLKLKKVYARMSSLSLTNSLSCHLQQYKHRQETDLANELPHVLGDMWTYRRQDERLGLNEAEHQIAVHPRWLQLTVLVASRLTPTTMQTVTWLTCPGLALYKIMQGGNCAVQGQADHLHFSLICWKQSTRSALCQTTDVVLLAFSAFQPFRTASQNISGTSHPLLMHLHAVIFRHNGSLC